MKIIFVNALYFTKVYKKHHTVENQNYILWKVALALRLFKLLLLLAKQLIQIPINSYIRVQHKSLVLLKSIYDTTFK